MSSRNKPGAIYSSSSSSSSTSRTGSIIDSGTDTDSDSDTGDDPTYEGPSRECKSRSNIRVDSKGNKSVVIRRRMGCCGSRPKPKSKVKLPRRLELPQAEQQDVGAAGAVGGNNQEQIEMQGLDSDNDNGPNSVFSHSAESGPNSNPNPNPNHDQNAGDYGGDGDGINGVASPTVTLSASSQDSGSMTDFDEDEIPAQHATVEMPQVAEAREILENVEVHQEPEPEPGPGPGDPYLYIPLVADAGNGNNPVSHEGARPSPRGSQQIYQEQNGGSASTNGGKGSGHRRNRKVKPEALFVLSSGFSISKQAFKRAAQGILQGYQQDFRFRSEAIAALQTASEDYMAGIFEDCNKCARSREAATVQPKDMSLVLDIRGNKSLMPERTSSASNSGRKRN